MKHVVIARSYNEYRYYCDHRGLDRAQYKFVDRPSQLRGLSIPRENIHLATHDAMDGYKTSSWDMALASVDAGYALNG